jgi:hypothetical protein
MGHSLRWLAAPALALILSSGVTYTPTTTAQCIGLQTGSEYCVGESAWGGGAADDKALMGDESQFSHTAPQTPFEANEYNGYSPGTYPYYGSGGERLLYSDNEYCFPC